MSFFKLVKARIERCCIYNKSNTVDSSLMYIYLPRVNMTESKTILRSGMCDTRFEKKNRLHHGRCSRASCITLRLASLFSFTPSKLRYHHPMTTMSGLAQQHGQPICHLFQNFSRLTTDQRLAATPGLLPGTKYNVESSNMT